MAFFNGSIYSHMLQMRTGLTVTTPADHDELKKTGDYPTVYLLHGLSDDHTCWSRYSSCESYARTYRVNLVMPEVQRSFYCDMEYGLPYFSYITEELPRLVNRLFGISQNRESTYIMGLSMGGYGSLKCAFTRPDLYNAAASFSGVMDAARRSGFKEPEYYAISSHKERPQDDLYHLARALVQNSEGLSPELFITCGRQDFLYDANREFIRFLEDLKMPYLYEEWDGEHEWGFWDASLRKAFSHFFGKE